MWVIFQPIWMPIFRPASVTEATSPLQFTIHVSVSQLRVISFNADERISVTSSEYGHKQQQQQRHGAIKIASIEHKMNIRITTSCGNESSTAATALKLVFCARHDSEMSKKEQPRITIIVTIVAIVSVGVQSS
mmetsp:Transcript_21616/g.34895  ORF Transcript_21616/g.34895 Transcript_21616/m.34895 type:complete len:133 (-) Transcript_21616:949-1347(-)